MYQILLILMWCASQQYASSKPQGHGHSKGSNCLKYTEKDYSEDEPCVQRQPKTSFEVWCVEKALITQSCINTRMTSERPKMLKNISVHIYTDIPQIEQATLISFNGGILFLNAPLKLYICNAPTWCLIRWNIVWQHRALFVLWLGLSTKK